MVHVDVKKLGRIPDGGGHRLHGRAKGNRIKKTSNPGTAFIHNAVYDHSRLAYCEILAEERKKTVSAFWVRAHADFTSCGITVKRVLTDNGSAYRPTAFGDALGAVVLALIRKYPDLLTESPHPVWLRQTGGTPLRLVVSDHAQFKGAPLLMLTREDDIDVHA